MTLQNAAEGEQSATATAERLDGQVESLQGDVAELQRQLAQQSSQLTSQAADLAELAGTRLKLQDSQVSCCSCLIGQSCRLAEEYIRLNVRCPIS